MATSTTPATAPAPQDKDGLSSKFAHWMALYAAYLFLAGWTYFKYFFRMFGIDSGWLDFGVNDTVAQGFTVLFGTGIYLSVVYLIIFLISVALEIFSRSRSRFLEALCVLTLVALFPATYWIARNAGIESANADRSDKTSLPTISFTDNKCDYRGKLVYIKNDIFYVVRLVYATPPAKGASCVPDLSGEPSAVPPLWLFKSQELKDVSIVHYK